jgi:hypothetical protein
VPHVASPDLVVAQRAVVDGVSVVLDRLALEWLVLEWLAVPEPQRLLTSLAR